MQKFETKNSADGTVLRGGIYAPEHPRAVMTLVHGFGEHQGRYMDMIEHLYEDNIAIVTMDLRGHGTSDGKRGVCLDYALMIGDLDAQLSYAHKAFPELPHYLYGHSMGGGLVLRYASRPSRTSNIAGIIASAPLLRVPVSPPKAQIIGAKLLRKIVPKMTLPNPIPGKHISTLPDEQARYKADTLNHGKLGVGLAVDIIENGELVLARGNKINLPILLMHAIDDKLTASSASQEFSQLKPNCDFHMFENCEHEMHNDTARNDVYALMTKFISGVKIR